VISGDHHALATLANLPASSSSGTYSDTSSQPPSTASSTSSTPRIDAINSDLPERGSNEIPRFQSNSPHATELSNYPSRPSTTESSLRGSQFTRLPSKSCCCGSDATSDSPISTSNASSQLQPSITSPLHQQSLPQNLVDIYNPTANNYGMHHLAELARFEADFSAYELQVGCVGMQASSIAPLLPGQKSCDCGDTCACFACATHPSNRTTIDYVRYHNDLFMRTQFDQMVQYNAQPQASYIMSDYQPYASPQQHTPGNVQPTYGQPLKRPFHMQQHYGYPNVDWARTTAQQMEPLGTPTSGVGALQFQPQTPSTRTPHIPTYAPSVLSDDRQYRTMLQSQQQTLPGNNIPTMNTQVTATPHAVSEILTTTLDMADSPDDTSTLSPSSFLLQHFTLPDCDNVDGSCLCGDGCNCPGCLTHSGHERTGRENDTLTLNGDVEALLLEESQSI
jgi:hypothetical protein